MGYDESMKTIYFLFFVLGCSTMDRESCLTTNWYEKGVEDGKVRGENRFPEYRRECTKERISIATKSQEYQKGILEGLRSWCTFQNGFNEGLEGRGSTSLCDSVSPAFARGVEEGFVEFRNSLKRKRDEDELNKRYNSERDLFRNKILSDSDTRECAVDSDCMKEGKCRFNRCAHNNQYCTYGYECKVRGWCREVTEYARDRSVLSIRVCDYGR